MIIWLCHDPSCHGTWSTCFVLGSRRVHKEAKDDCSKSTILCFMWNGTDPSLWMHKSQIHSPMACVVIANTSESSGLHTRVHIRFLEANVGQRGASAWLHCLKGPSNRTVLDVSGWIFENVRSVSTTENSREAWKEHAQHHLGPQEKRESCWFGASYGISGLLPLSMEHQNWSYRHSAAPNSSWMFPNLCNKISEQHLHVWSCMHINCRWL